MAKSGAWLAADERRGLPLIVGGATRRYGTVGAGSAVGVGAGVTSAGRVTWERGSPNPEASGRGQLKARPPVNSMTVGVSPGWRVFESW